MRQPHPPLHYCCLPQGNDGSRRQVLTKQATIYLVAVVGLGSCAPSGGGGGGILSNITVSITGQLDRWDKVLHVA